MILDEQLQQALPARKLPWLGDRGHLAIFLWALALVMLGPVQYSLAISLFCLAVLALLYPGALGRLLRPRWLVLLALLIPAGMIFPPDQPAAGSGSVSFLPAGLLLGLQMALRAAVVLLAVDSFSGAVDIGAVAGMVERLGLRGLGFSIGIAINLLPSLRQTITNAWHSLRMRGGFRRRRRRALQLLFITVVTNALRRAEEITLAAEARAYRPEMSRTLPVKTGKLDLMVILLAGGCVLAVLFLR